MHAELHCILKLLCILCLVNCFDIVVAIVTREALVACKGCNCFVFLSVFVTIMHVSCYIPSVYVKNIVLDGIFIVSFYRKHFIYRSGHHFLTTAAFLAP